MSTILRPGYAPRRPRRLPSSCHLQLLRQLATRRHQSMHALSEKQTRFVNSHCTTVYVACMRVACTHGGCAFYNACAGFPLGADDTQPYSVFESPVDPRMVDGHAPPSDASVESMRAEYQSRLVPPPLPSAAVMTAVEPVESVGPVADPAPASTPASTDPPLEKLGEDEPDKASLPAVVIKSTHPGLPFSCHACRPRNSPPYL